jgi:hypothetical protein
MLNRVPLVKWFKLREVISFSGMYGELSIKNNPAIYPKEGLFHFPEGTHPLSKTPYIEASAGVENIFKILRVDYYRRLTYLGDPDTKRNGFRIAMRFTF